MVMVLVDWRRKLGCLAGLKNASINANNTGTEARRQMELQSILRQENSVTVNLQ